MIGTVLLAVVHFFLPPSFALLVRRYYGLPLRSPRFFSMWAAGAAIGTAGDLLIEQWPAASGYAASALLALVLWWNSRRKRRKALRVLGAKAKARIAAMKRKMPRASPGLVPQGARG